MEMDTISIKMLKSIMPQEFHFFGLKLTKNGIKCILIDHQVVGQKEYLLAIDSLFISN